MRKLNFADWFRSDYLWEFADVKNMPTDHIELTDSEPEEFDEEEARDDCERRADRMDFMDGCYDDVYDSPEDDPNFTAFDPDEWEDDNPAPDREDYETDDEYDAAVEEWEAEREQAASEGDSVESWEEDMAERRERAEECESEARWEWVSDCVAEKEREWQANNQQGEGDLEYRFQVEGDDYAVFFLKNDPIKIGKNYIDKVWGITFEGPQGFSTTNKGNQNQVYTQLLLACKKLMEQEEPNVLQFTPAEPAMGLVYQQFVKMFLSGIFIQTSFGNYVRKKALMEAIKDESPEFKRDIYGKIMDANRQIMDKEEEVRAEKGRQREGFQKAKQLVGDLAAVKMQRSGIKRVWDGNSYKDQEPTYDYFPAIVLSATFQSAKGTATVLVPDRYSGLGIDQQNHPAVMVVSAQEAIQDSDFINRLRKFVQGLINEPVAAQRLGQKALQVIRQLVPELASQLQQAVMHKEQQPTDLFNNPPPPPPQNPSGWSHI